jgi:perosamine synthetase
MHTVSPPPIPLAPVLSLASFRRGGAHASSVLDAGEALFVTSGRVAIALALRAMGVGPGEKVLVPAYHSPSMVPPVLWRGAQPTFYRVRPDTSVDLADVAAKLDSSTRVLVVTHYFGFPQRQIATIRALCDARGIGLLEDCAHCLIGEHGGRPVGAWGDYAIASSMKFLPIYEGGLLVSGRHSLGGIQLRPAGPGFEAKVALNSLERGFAHGRLAPVRAALWLPMAAKDALWRRVKTLRAGEGKPIAPDSSDSSFDFDPGWVDKRSSWFARTMARLASPGRIAAARRANHERLDSALRGLPGGRPLHARLPQGACPWVYPFVADDPERLFASLRAAGVPVVRFGLPLWQGVDASVCANAADLSRRVLAFPVHQELRERELEWMVAAIRKALPA